MYAVIYHVIKLIILVYLIFRIMKIKIKKKQYAENSGKITLDYIFFYIKPTILARSIALILLIYSMNDAEKY